MTVASSCFFGNTSDAVGSSTSAAATGNWWGASDGPSGAGPGSGDEVDEDGVVDFSVFATSPLEACRPLELVANTHFEIDQDGDGDPDRWRLRRLQRPATA